MNGTFRSLSALAITFSMSATASPVYSDAKGKTKARGKQDSDQKGKNGRTAGDLPYGLEQVSERTGNLPAGLQKKKDDGGSLTRGLAQGGKKQSSGIRKKGAHRPR